VVKLNGQVSMFRHHDEHGSLDLWKMAAGRDVVMLNGVESLWSETRSRICEAHFEDRFIVNDGGRKRLLAGAYPTINVHSYLTEHLEGQELMACNQQIRARNQELVDRNNELEARCQALVNENQRLIAQNKDLTARNIELGEGKLRNEIELVRSEHDASKKLLNKVASFGMQRVMSGSSKRVKKFPTSEIAKFSLLSLIGKARYNFVAEILGLPLPSIRTLQRRRENFKVDTGICDSAFDILKDQVRGLDERGRQAIITFDAMSLSGRAEFSNHLGRMLESDKGFVIQVVSMFGLFRQTVYVGLEATPFDASVIRNLIDKLYVECGIQTRGLTSDHGTENQALWKELGIDIDQGFFNHRFGNKEARVLVFGDMTHAIKLFRKHVIDELTVYEGTVIHGKELLTRLIGLDGSHITSEHVDYGTSKKGPQNAKLALDVISSETADLLEEKINTAEARALAHLIRLQREYFDLFNVTVKKVDQQFTRENLDDKEVRLQLIAESIRNTFWLKPSLTPVQIRKAIRQGKGPIVHQAAQIRNCSNIIELCKDMFTEYVDVDFKMPTFFTSSDIVESFFGFIRSFGTYTNPTADQFLLRVRFGILFYNSGLNFSKNVELPEGYDDERLTQVQVLERFYESIQHESLEDEREQNDNGGLGNEEYNDHTKAEVERLFIAVIGDGSCLYEADSMNDIFDDIVDLLSQGNWSWNRRDLRNHILSLFYARAREMNVLEF
jgi:hypothetical protein